MVMQKNQIVYVSSFGIKLSFYVTSIDNPKPSLPILDEKINVETPIGAEIFFQKLESIVLLNQVKGLVFIYCQPPELNYPVFHFRERCREFCYENEIICHFTFYKTLMAFTALTISKVKVFENESIIIVSPRGDPVAVWAITFKNGKYLIEDYRNLPWASDSFRWRQQIIGYRTPNKIIFMKMSYECNLRNLVNAFNPLNPIILNGCYMDYVATAAVEKILQLSNHPNKCYDVVPLTQELYLTSDDQLLGKISNDVKIPCQVSVTVSSNQEILCGLRSLDIYMQENDDQPEKVNFLQFKNMDDIDIVLKVDVDSFFEYELMPKYVSVKDTKARIVLKEDNFTVTIWKDSKIIVEEECVSGLKNVPYFIDFSEKNPAIGKDARQRFLTHPSFVVFDIKKLLSLTSLDTINQNWSFSLKTDGEYPVLIDVDTIDGRRQYTPAFIFAIICKWIILQIKKNTGDFLNELEVELQLSVVNQALKENIVAAFRMLKINLNFV